MADFLKDLAVSIVAVFLLTLSFEMDSDLWPISLRAVVDCALFVTGLWLLRWSAKRWGV